MKYIKPINEFWNPFKKKEPLSFQQVEVMCTELVDIIYDIFDEYNIVDGNDDYYSGTEGDILFRNVEPYQSIIKNILKSIILTGSNNI